MWYGPSLKVTFTGALVIISPRDKSGNLKIFNRSDAAFISTTVILTFCYNKRCNNKQPKTFRVLIPFRTKMKRSRTCASRKDPRLCHHLEYGSLAGRLITDHNDPEFDKLGIELTVDSKRLRRRWQETAIATTVSLLHRRNKLALITVGYDVFFFCWLSHFKMSFCYPTTHKKARG